MTWIDLRDIWLACQNFKATMKRLQPDCKSSVANLDHAITDMVRQHRDDSIPEANERLLEDHLSSSYRPDIDETDVLDWTSKLRSLTMQTEAITQAHGEGDKKSEESPSAEDDGGSLQSRGTSRSMTGNETKEFSMRQSGKEGSSPVSFDLGTQFTTAAEHTSTNVLPSSLILRIMKE
ncbi:hypothetical protein QFC21_004449 [Naganishia friedmannii]|uniref:Uncharacterized protein n=1 Tax=Naganishia friedmannii TaxID=89922 RepID=A0ACC2VG86_9TREE|nr:hypothetical protein QFC21_004449 [Naganishia friedmannii]